MEITFLGTGTSQGVPVIGCECEVCRSADRKDKRLRTAVLIKYAGVHLAIDAGPDFRQQMLLAGVHSLDGILITHEHNDHIIGLDDVRPFNFRQGKKMPVFATKEVQNQLKKRFAYAFQANPYPGAPGFQLVTIDKMQPFSAEGIMVQPIEVMHGSLPVLGFRINNFTYITDAKTISSEEMVKAKNSDILVINALHHRSHHSHLNLSEAIEIIELLQPKQAYLIHMSHYMGLHEEVEKQLPPQIKLAFDGLTLHV